MDTKEIKEKYEKLQKEHDLPSFDELDKEFELLYFSSVLEISFPLRFIRRRINDRITGFINQLQGLIQPNPQSPVSLEEAGFLEDGDKEKISDLIRKMMILSRRSSLLDLEFDDKEDVRFIKEAIGVWSDYKKEIVDILGKVRKGWEKKAKEDSGAHYFG